MGPVAATTAGDAVPISRRAAASVSHASGESCGGVVGDVPANGFRIPEIAAVATLTIETSGLGAGGVGNDITVGLTTRFCAFDADSDVMTGVVESSTAARRVDDESDVVVNDRTTPSSAEVVPCVSVRLSPAAVVVADDDVDDDDDDDVAPEPANDDETLDRDLECRFVTSSLVVSTP